VATANHPKEETEMSQPTTTRPEARERRFVMGPEQVRATILTTGADTDGGHDLIDSVLPAGSMTPLHLHTRYEERVYVISGSLTVWVGPDKLTVGPGELYHIPTNVPHTPSRPAPRTPTPSSSAPRPGSPSSSPAPAPPPTWPPRRPNPTWSGSRP
jgi:mannose-6-phosphate isomerase-like protein (cupin superfamily)